MSVHGCPADTSIFYCNLKKLGLLSKLQEETVGSSHADIDQDDVSLAGVLQGAVGRAICYTPLHSSEVRMLTRGHGLTYLGQLE